MEHAVEALNPGGRTPPAKSQKTTFHSCLAAYCFLLGCLNPVVLLVVLVTIFFGQKKLRGRWLVICGLLAGIVAVGFFDAAYSYLTPVLEIVDLMRGNALKLMP